MLRGTGVAQVAMLAVVALAAVGCSADEDGGSGAIDPQIRSKVAGLYLGSETVGLAREQLISQCMTAAGFTYRPTPVSAHTIPQAYSDDVANARSNGFGLSDRLETTEELLAREPTQAERDRGYVSALLGSESERIEVRQFDGLVMEVPGGGCRAEADARLFGSVEDAEVNFHLTSNVIGNVLLEAIGGPDVVDVLEKWSSCMEKAGFRDMNSRDAARGAAELAYEDKGADVAQAIERELAVAAATCDGEVGYSEVARRAEDIALTAFMKANESVVQGQAEVQSRALAQAREALE